MNETCIVIKKAAIKKPTVNLETGQKILKKVCAYARVSTDLEDQKNSYAAQLDEYETRIKNNPDWEFVGLYSDEGISGTSTKKREGFQDMITDALDGKIDLILVKSISRFARNTVDCLKTIRALKEKCVEVWFDKENISTADPSVDIMLTIHASFAQEESKSISENVKWGVRKRMAKGQRKMRVKTTLGYDEIDGKIVVNKEEAKVVKKVFDMYIEGNSMRDITDYLNGHNIPKKATNEDWKLADVMRMLGNEKYIGDFVMQKTVVVDFLSHKAVKNDGIIDQYIVPNHHEAIISKPVFEAVRAIRDENNKFGGMMFEPINKLTSILYCSCCLRPLKYADVITSRSSRKFLTCRAIRKNDTTFVGCDIHETVDFEAAHKATSDVVNRFMVKDESIFKNIEEAYHISINKAHDDLVGFTNEASEINEKMQLLVKLATDSDDINKYKDDYELLEKQLDEINTKIAMIKKDLTEAAKFYINANYISNFYKDKLITYSIVKKVIKVAFRLPNNKIRFVLADNELVINKKLYDEVMKLKPIYSSSALGSRKKPLEYDVVRLGGANDGN